MTTHELAQSCGFSLKTTAEAKEIKGAFAGDLLSWAMSRVTQSDVWFTVMGNINAVAVACIVLCHGAALAEDALARARQEGIVIMTTELSEYEAITAFNKVSG